MAGGCPGLHPAVEVDRIDAGADEGRDCFAGPVSRAAGYDHGAAPCERAWVEVAERDVLRVGGVAGRPLIVFANVEQAYVRDLASSMKRTQDKEIAIITQMLALRGAQPLPLN